MSESYIRSCHDGPLLHVSIDRPQKRNALTPRMLDDLAAAVRAADERPEVRAVIISATGPMFSAGVDIMALAALRGEATGQHPGRWLRSLADRLQRALNVIEAVEVPVIGALHGQVMGLGMELMLAFDLIVASEDCRFSIPEARLGLVADVGGTTRLSRTVGPRRAKELLLTAGELDAATAQQWGLVNRVCPVGEHLQAASQLAEQIAQNAPLAVGLAKLIIDQGQGVDRATQMAIERWAQSELIDSADTQEAMLAFMEKRAPKFQGK